LQDVPGLSLISSNESERCNYQYVIIEVDEQTTGISRDHLVRVLHAENILARRYFYPGCHEMEPYRSYFPHARLLLPRTQDLTRRVMSLPTGTAVKPEDISWICHLLNLAIQHSDEINRYLHSSA
jgi:dTDP-4-amino-4,6-dideoxygalactose transaminase